MSKQKSKDKKSDNNMIDPAVFDAQKKELISCTFTVKKLEQRLAMITKQNIRLIQQCRENKHMYQQRIEQLSIKNQTNEKRLLILSGQKTKFEIQNEQKKTKINLLQKQLSDQQHLRSVQLSEYKKNVSFQINKYENQLMEYKQYMSERDELEAERANLRERIQIEKADKVRQVADKEREKVQATDKLRDEMLKKIREMRTNLLSLKKDQLETTTRLTILQNHQLTSELQYQSKQTQKLIFKNQQMQTKISVLERDIEIHKEVEEQLAKRSHLSKGMIKKLNVRIAEFEEQVADLRKQILTKNTDQNGQKERQVLQAKNQMVVQTLNNNLEDIQKKYVELSTRYEFLLKQKEDMLIKLQKYDSTSNKLGTVLLKYFTEILQAKIPDVFDINQEQHLQININHLKEKSVDAWTNTDIQNVVRILLACIKPMIAKNNIPIPSIRKNIHLLQEIDANINLSRSSKNLHTLNSQNLKSLQTRSIKLPQSKHRMVEATSNQNVQKNGQTRIKHDVLSQDRYRQVIKQKLHELPMGVASKIVTSNLRQWGKTVNFTGNRLKRKYKLNDSYR